MSAFAVGEEGSAHGARLHNVERPARLSRHAVRQRRVVGSSQTQKAYEEHYDDYGEGAQKNDLNDVPPPPTIDSLYGASLYRSNSHR